MRFRTSHVTICRACNQRLEVLTLLRHTCLRFGAAWPLKQKDGVRDCLCPKAGGLSHFMLTPTQPSGLQNPFPVPGFNPDPQQAATCICQSQSPLNYGLLIGNTPLAVFGNFKLLQTLNRLPLSSPPPDPFTYYVLLLSTLCFAFVFCFKFIIFVLLPIIPCPCPCTIPCPFANPSWHLVVGQELGLRSAADYRPGRGAQRDAHRPARTTAQQRVRHRVLHQLRHNRSGVCRLQGAGRQRQGKHCRSLSVTW